MVQHQQIFTNLCFLAIILIKRSTCQMIPYVVNGTKATIQKFPHSAHLAVHCVNDDGSSDIWGCGSSILNQKILLTAAHCLVPCTADSSMSVAVGNSNKKYGTKSTVRSFLVHPQYIFTTTKIANDLGLVKLRSSLKFNSGISRVAVMKNPPYFEKAQIAGWGVIDEINKNTTDDLRYVDQYVLKENECKKQFNVAKGIICASASDDKQYSSRGDSGSALVVRGYIQIGVVSYKTPRTSRSVVMYTDTGSFYGWIQKYSKYLHCL